MFFSIIIPTYNRAHIIEETIKSVQNQTFDDWECIVVDDGSIDSTREVVENLIQVDSRIKYIYQENAERSAARNNGISHSKGDYICFLDSDDTFEKNHLEFLYSEIERAKIKIGLFFTNYQIIQGNSIQNISCNVLSPDTIHYLCYNPIIPARVCIHNAILKELKFDSDIVVVEDLILWLKIAQKYPFFQIQKTTVNYHMHEDNSVNIKNTGYQKRLAGLIKMRKRYPQVWNSISQKDQNFLIGNTHFGIAKHYLFHEKKVKAIKHLFFSIMYQRRHNQLKHKIWLFKNMFFGVKLNH